MTNYLALIRKADFTDLFNFGKLHINNDMIVDFKCDVKDLPIHKDLFDTLTLYANPFDNAFTYLIIHYCKEGDIELHNDVNIEDVKHIYPLDRESKANFEMTFDERIRIEDPIWKEAVLDLQKHQKFVECKKGALNLRQICGFKIDSSNCSGIISDDIIKEVVNGFYEDARPLGEQSIWSYLLRYERHSFYPHNTVGCFMDMVNVACNRYAQKEVEESDIQGTDIFQLLNSYRNSDIKFEDLYRIVKNKGGNFIKMTQHYAHDVDFIKIGSLFFILRNRYPDDFIYEPKFIDYCKKYDIDFELALYLLGIIMGHNHTYDCMYEELPLAIFKTKPVHDVIIPSTINNDQGEETDGRISQQSNAADSPEANNLHENEPPTSVGPSDVKPDGDLEAVNSSETEIQYKDKSQTPVERAERNGGEALETAESLKEAPQVLSCKSELNTDEESELKEKAETDGQHNNDVDDSSQQSGKKVIEESATEESDSNKASSRSDSTPRVMPKFPCKMAKLKKDGSFRKINNNPVIINNLEDFVAYEAKGYVQINLLEL